ncbi:Heparan sulfate 2-O-sulfotransferase hst-2-like [Homarus americanus]|uniref:Heparan sulfate 2-O-sulfotransferase hst-2-like n=1 Tax=Homarus americanus TaxID=6706 RepID=A0A8J5N5H6_HOMAM|nr:Heparan sulfate 2-O-sulfotransferase hst-2-like [Homarus americanus]
MLICVRSTTTTSFYDAASLLNSNEGDILVQEPGAAEYSRHASHKLRVTWMVMCGALLMLWQAPDPSSSNTHRHPSPSPTHASKSSSRTHVSNLHYLQDHETSSFRSSSYKAIPGVSSSHAPTVTTRGRPPSSRVNQRSVSPIQPRASLAWPAPPTSSVTGKHQHPIRHLSSGYVRGINAEVPKPPIKARLRHKEYGRHERLVASNSEHGHLIDRRPNPSKDRANNDNKTGNKNPHTEDYTHYDPSDDYVQSNDDNDYNEVQSEYVGNNSNGEEVNEYIKDDSDYTGGIYNVTPPDASLLVYNRIPKLSRHLGFEHLSSLIYDKRQLSQDDQEELGEDRPVYINIIRNPVEQFISSFYYRRSDERLNRLHSRGHLSMVSPRWINRTVEECVSTNDSECLFLPGEEKETFVTFFCGHHIFCRTIGHKDALQLAKQVVSEDYSVVGLVKHMELTLQLMETLVPRYLTGALKIYENIRQREHMIVNKNQKKPEVPTVIQKELSRRMVYDLDFYNFLEQRLFEQKETFLSKQSIQ